MSEWERDKNAGRWMVRGPMSSVGAVLLAVVTAALGAKYYTHEGLTPIQQALLPDYVKRTAAAVTIGDVKPQLERSRAFLAASVYEGHSLLQLFRIPLAAGGIVLVLLLIVAIPRDIRRARERRLGRRTKGTWLLDTRTFTKRVGGDGFSIRQARGPAVVLPARLETSHMLIAGDNGTGKSTLIAERLDQIAMREAVDA